MKSVSFRWFVCILMTVVIVGCSERKTVLKRRIMSLDKEAAMALSRKDYQGAEKAYLDILKLDPKNQFVKNYLVLLYLRDMNKPQKAKALLEELLKEYPHNSAYLNNLAGIYQVEKKYDKAIELYQKAKKYNPEYQMPFYNIGKIYILQGKYSDAVKELQEGLKHGPKDSNMIATTGLALLLNNQIEQAHKLLLDAYKKTPKSVIIDTANTGSPICLATITSGTVDIPTASAPMVLKYLYSAGVSKVGPVTAQYTPFLTVIPCSAAIFSTNPIMCLS
jgi:tetratricopeptide (TPR) repeat protein